METSLALPSSSFDSHGDPKEKKKDVYENFEYSFQTFCQYAISSLCYCLSPTAYVYFDESEQDNPPVSLMLITAVLVCLPIYYVEVFVGRYIQNSILHLKYMVPIAKGLPYVHMTVTVLYAIGIGYYLTDCLLYFLMCFQKDLPWTVCPENITETCYYHERPAECDNCMHSSMAYWKYIYMEEPALLYKDLRLGVPILHRFVSSGVCWLMVFLITAVAYKQRHKCLSTMFYIYCVTITVLFAVVLLNVGATTELPYIFTVATHSFLDTTLWAEALMKSVKLFKVGHAHHVLAGARLPEKAPIGLWCVYFCLLLLGMAMLSTMFGMAVAGIQKHHTGSGPEKVLHLHQLFVVDIPGGLSYTGAAHAWSALFFFSMVTILAANVVSRIITLHLTITNFKPSLQKFKVYLLVGYCLSFALLSTCLLSEKHYILSRMLLESTTVFVEVIATTLLIVVMFWIYGIQTVSDDILFLTSHKPAKFWTVTWYACPIALVAFLVYFTITVLETEVYLFVLISTAVLLLPLPVYAVLQVFVYVKKRRLSGLIEPEVEWGMPDPEKRHMRRTFNPRTEMKFQSKRKVCSHKCILNSTYLKAIVHYENVNRNILLSTNEETRQSDLALRNTNVTNENNDVDK